MWAIRVGVGRRTKNACLAPALCASRTSGTKLATVSPCPSCILSYKASPGQHCLTSVWHKPVEMIPCQPNPGLKPRLPSPAPGRQSAPRLPHPSPKQWKTLPPSLAAAGRPPGQQAGPWLLARPAAGGTRPPPTPLQEEQGCEWFSGEDEIRRGGAVAVQQWQKL